MAIHILTSWSGKLWERYAHNFMRSYERHGPVGATLHIYLEDCPRAVLEPYQSRRTTITYDLHKDCPEWREFMAANAGDPVKNGRRRDPRFHWKEKWIAAGYAFRWDAVRFSRKVYALDHCAQRVAGSKLFWLDADILFTEHLAQDDFSKWLPDEYEISHLGRGPTYHSECGFVGYNLTKPSVLNFVRAFRRLYDTGEIYAMDEWHDSYVFDKLRERLGMNCYNLGDGHRRSDVFSSSPLGRFMRHFKGDRKRG